MVQSALCLRLRGLAAFALVAIGAAAHASPAAAAIPNHDDGVIDRVIVAMPNGGKLVAAVGSGEPPYIAVLRTFLFVTYIFLCG